MILDTPKFSYNPISVRIETKFIDTNTLSKLAVPCRYYKLIVKYSGLKCPLV